MKEGYFPLYLDKQEEVDCRLDGRQKKGFGLSSAIGRKTYLKIKNDSKISKCFRQ